MVEPTRPTCGFGEPLGSTLALKLPLPPQKPAGRKTTNNRFESELVIVSPRSPPREGQGGDKGLRVFASLFQQGSGTYIYTQTYVSEMFGRLSARLGV